MPTPAAMPTKRTIIPPRQVEPQTPAAGAPAPKSPQKTTITVVTKSDGITGDVRLNGKSIPATIVDHVDIELDHDGSGVVWVGLVADRIVVRPASGRKR